jgi:hypothetical protein
MRRLSYLLTFSIIVLVALVPIAGAQSSEQTVSTQEATSQDTQGSEQTVSTQEEPCKDPDPSNFVDKVDNKFFPLEPGTTFIYKGETDGVPTTNRTIVTHHTKEILGVKTTVVRDRAFERERLVEDTFDWYAQDQDGNVCYFGEDTKELDKNGNVISTEGSWQAGEPVPSPGTGIAKPGVIMEAHPQVGDTYQQEEAKGVAEDMAKVLKLDASTCVPYKCFRNNNLLLTKEWTPLEPDVVEHKYYAPRVGFIRGVMVKGGKEHTELVRITTGG